MLNYLFSSNTVLRITIIVFNFALTSAYIFKIPNLFIGNGGKETSRENRRYLFIRVNALKGVSSRRYGEDAYKNPPIKNSGVAETRYEFRCRDENPYMKNVSTRVLKSSKIIFIPHSATPNNFYEVPVILLFR